MIRILLLLMVMGVSCDAGLIAWLDKPYCEGGERLNIFIVIENTSEKGILIPVGDEDEDGWVTPGVYSLTFESVIIDGNNEPKDDVGGSGGSNDTRSNKSRTLPPGEKVKILISHIPFAGESAGKVIFLKIDLGYELEEVLIRVYGKKGD